MPAAIFHKRLIEQFQRPAIYEINKLDQLHFRKLNSASLRFL
ncbi:hypothetical protein FP2506_15974 [Fulvimarina pelagi HTCC2506]|uniref:Uncharacterized protein n=1 Tax=Fulvimarina pelagi HTCC2506 TaxID=314231 RepID=Q0G385_9HYPH|nr:hypothetical protein FP2506_15974 [Fulvimarina pelagi HTCC2506]